jgi:hypothetical protein
MVRTTNLDYDQFAGNPCRAVTYHLNLLPLANQVGANSFDLGKDEIAWNTGTRNIKFLADYTNATSRNQNNDCPIFRYSDILLMKAEAIQRGGTPTMGQTALSLVNALRAQRTTTAALGAITLNDIYIERGREMTFECWRRSDMIRFGHFEDSYGLSKQRRYLSSDFPYTQTAIATNSKLVQNQLCDSKKISFSSQQL